MRIFYLVRFQEKFIWLGYYRRVELQVWRADTKTVTFSGGSVPAEWAALEFFFEKFGKILKFFRIFPNFSKKNSGCSQSVGTLPPEKVTVFEPGLQT